MATTRYADATDEALTVAEVRDWLRQDSDDSDTEIAGLILAARHMCEGECRRSIMPTTWESTSDEFTDALRLENPRVISVTSVKYYDEDGVLQTLSPSDYQVDTDSEPGWIVPAYGVTWPATRQMANAVRVRYIAGYADAGTVPEPIKVWMKLHIAHFYRNKESSVHGQMQPLVHLGSLLDPHRIWGY